ncbi:hypothetical protein AMJ85_04405 [candidate division BRC1 bacterium SM23_51]|nr:MAG: hypothetical protein AMJ85_04405 [candidate division BRC1 bacterium SM23_51]
MAFVFYFIGAVLALGAWVLRGRGRWVLRSACGAIVAAAIAHTALILHRWIAGGHPPLAGMFDAVVFFSWTTVVAFGAAEIIFRTRWLALFVAATEVILLAYASDFDPAIRPLIPVLKSTWLTIHVFAYMIAYGVMTIGCFAAVCYYAFLAAQGDGEATQRFDRLTYRLVAFGFPLLTVGILTGAVWADRTWGRYWGWDPKETWSLITWIVYAAFLHLRYWSRSWAIEPQRRSAVLNWIAILGFGAIIFTFLLLKYLPSADESLHIYL